jgi:hypothetical protein
MSLLSLDEELLLFFNYDYFFTIMWAQERYKCIQLQVSSAQVYSLLRQALSHVVMGSNDDQEVWKESNI